MFADDVFVEFIGSGKTSGIGWVVINLLQIIFPSHVSSGSDSLESLVAFLSSDFSSVFCHIPSNTGQFFIFVHDIYDVFHDATL